MSRISSHLKKHRSLWKSPLWPPYLIIISVTSVSISLSTRTADKILDWFGSCKDKLKSDNCDFIALFVYYPLAKFSFILEKIGLNFHNFPLYFYRNLSFYVMRTDSRDRFGSPMEKRYSKKKITLMMKNAGLEKIKFKNSLPFWTVVGFKKK